MTNDLKNEINDNVSQRTPQLEGRKHAKEALHDNMRELDRLLGKGKKHKEALTIIMRSIDWKNLTNEQESSLWDYFVNKQY